MPNDSYSAFISYSHAGDHRLAKSLQKLLGKLARPWYRRRKLDVFLDESDLAAAPDLWASIEQALNKSEYLILLASPESAASNWVNKEVAHFLNREDRTEEHILLAVTAGELHWNEAAAGFDTDLSNCIPPALQGSCKREPLWVDFSAHRGHEDLSRTNPGFFEGCARLAARVHGKELSELIGEDYRQHRRTMAIAWSAVIALVILTGLSVFSSIRANKNAAEAIAALKLANANEWAAQLRRASLLLRVDNGQASAALDDEDDFPSNKRGLAWQILKARSNHLLAEHSFASPVKDMVASKIPGGGGSVLIATADGNLWSWEDDVAEPRVFASAGQAFNGWVKLSDTHLIAFEANGKTVLARLQGNTLVTSTELPVTCGNLIFDNADPDKPGVVTYCDDILKWWDAQSGVENTDWRYEWILNPEPESEENWVEAYTSQTAFSGASRHNLWFSTQINYDEGSGSYVSLIDLESHKTDSIDGIPSPEKVLDAIPLDGSGSFLIRSQLHDLVTYAPPVVRRIERDRDVPFSYSEQSTEIKAVAGSDQRHAVLNAAGDIKFLDANLTAVNKILRLPDEPDAEKFSRYKLLLSAKTDRLFVLDEGNRLRVFSTQPEALKSSAGRRGSRVQALAHIAGSGALFIERQGPGSEEYDDYQWYPEAELQIEEFSYPDEQYPPAEENVEAGPAWIDLERVWTGGALKAAEDGYRGKVIAKSTDELAYLFERYSGEEDGNTFNLYEPGTDEFTHLFIAGGEEKELTYADVQIDMVAAGFSNSSVEVYRRMDTGTFRLDRACPVEGSWPLVKMSADNRFLAVLTDNRPQGSERFYNYDPPWRLNDSIFDEEIVRASTGRLFLLDLESHGCQWLAIGEDVSYLAEAVSFHASSDNGKLQLLFGHIDGALSKYDIEEAVSEKNDIGFAGPVTAIHGGHDLQVLVTGQTTSERLGTKVIDLDNGIELIELRLADLAVERVLFDSGNHTLAMATEDGRVWWLELKK